MLHLSEKTKIPNLLSAVGFSATAVMIVMISDWAELDWWYGISAETNDVYGEESLLL